MTGFARSEGDAPGISFAWEIKSVNGKSLDLRLRLAPGFDGLEPQLRAALASRFRRGNITAGLSVTRTAPPAVRINRDMLAQFVGLLAEVSDEVTSRIKADPPRLDGLLGLRGIIETVEDEPEAVLETRRDAVLDAWSAALDRLARTRAEEGARLAAVLNEQLSQLAELAAAASASAAAQPEAIRTRLQGLLAELAGIAPTLPEERVAQEVAMLVSRADVREELDRLRAHLAQAGELLGRSEAVGRQLDFLCQELNREANTLCAKSSDIELTRIGLALKVAVEQFREQVQNLE